VIIASSGRAEEFGLNEAICVLQSLPMMFLRREEQYLGVVKQLLLLFDRHHWQISACHGDPPMMSCMHTQSQPWICQFGMRQTIGSASSKRENYCP
jgi:hypothetical protein